MLTATGKSARRLFLPGDAYHPARESAKTTPKRADVPEEYRNLLDWYQNEYVKRHQAGRSSILSLIGLGRDLWNDEDPDQYVKRLREGWK
jgi:hypothetical protein